MRVVKLIAMTVAAAGVIAAGLAQGDPYETPRLTADDVARSADVSRAEAQALLDVVEDDTAVIGQPVPVPGCRLDAASSRRCGR